MVTSRHVQLGEYVKLEPPPRRVSPEIARVIRKDRKILTVSGLILVFSGIGLGVFFWLLVVPPYLKELDSSGAVAPGVVDDMVEHRNVHYGNVHPWGIKYHFEPESGGTYRGETETTDLKFVKTHSVGDAIEISYDPSNPALNKIRGVTVAGFSMWVLLFPGAQFLAGVILLMARHVRVAAALEVYEQGTQTQGRLLKAKLLRHVNMWTKHPVSLRYVFEDEMGQECFGKMWSWHPKAREFKEGQECTVLYNRANPSRNLLYDALALYRE